MKKEPYDIPLVLVGLIASGKVIEINLQSVIQSELDKQLQEKTA